MIFGLIFLNGIFAMSEIAIISARKSWLAADAERGSKSAKAALNLANSPDRFLSTIQIGITLIGIVTGLYSGDVFSVYLAPVFENLGVSVTTAFTLAKIIIVIAVTYLTIIFGELVPKRVGMTAAEKVAKVIARPMQFLSSVAYPFVWILSQSTATLFRLFRLKDGEMKVTEDEIKSLVREGKEDGEVQEVEQGIVERVFNLGDRNLESIMTHRSDIVWLAADAGKEEIKSVIEKSPFDKYPVGDSDFSNIIGVAYLKDIFLKIDVPDFSLKTIVQPVDYFYENMEVYAALEKMKVDCVRCALVCDEFGNIKGLVTLKDIMEALVGEIPEPGEEPEIIVRKDGSCLIDGQCSFYTFLEYFKMTDLYSEHEYNTLSGLILELHGNIPKEGDTLTWQNFTFEIVDMDGARIDKILATQKTESSSESE